MELIKFDKTQLNKQGATNLANQLLTALEHGEVNPIDLTLVFKTIEKAKDIVEPKLKELTLQAAESYEGKAFTYNGNFVEVTDSLGVRFDFSNCNHLEYEVLQKEVKERTARMKEIEEELKAMKKPREEVNTETGEVYTVYPPIKKSTTGVKITLK